MQTEAWNSAANKVNFNLEIDLQEFKKLIPADTPILDYGCGYGRTCNTLKTSGYLNVVGFDTSSSMISRGNLEFPSLALFQNRDVKLEYSTNSFGAIVLCAVLTCVPEQADKTRIITEIHRLLKRDAVLHIV